MNEKKYHFALDVGTRTIVGVILEEKNSRFNIAAVEIAEHATRAMMDGQIHDIPAVTEVIKGIKMKLEKKLGQTLTEVSIAAAGRALYTQKASTHKKVSPNEPIEEDNIHALIADAVNEAQKLLIKNKVNNGDNSYYCVGYSVTRYLLDGIEIKNLLGQRGQIIQVEIIATFLPKIVVESLNAVIKAASLKIKNMTLEPIAASNVVITEGMRKLNLALVDIGAGTSDIAISKEGSIIAYGMVPSAGDEITEALSEILMVDFSTAEYIKRQLNKSDYVVFSDIFGNTVKLQNHIIIEKIASATDTLAKRIADEILELNGKPPQGIILIGGGSLTPFIREKLAVKLEIHIERIGIRGREVIEGVTGASKKLCGPMSITPIGIALMEAKGFRNTFEYITLNGQTIRIFGRENLKVLDVLLAAGIDNFQIFARPGKGMTIEINGQLRVIKGSKGTPCKIVLNGKPASLEELVLQGDDILFEPCVKGNDATGYIRDILQDGIMDKSIYFQGNKKFLKPQIFLNGAKATLNTPLSDKALITIQPLNTIYEVLKYLDVPVTNSLAVKVNGTIKPLDTVIKDGDEIILFNKNETVEKNNSVTPVVVNSQRVYIENKNPILLLDVFKVIDFPLTPPMDKKHLVLMINGEKATYTTAVKPNDTIDIYWAAAEKKADKG
ncbi:MAG: cell division FtsA domain-containing protein [Bacillota bacterium]